MRIGIYGGSFNPVHNGHIHLALTAAEDYSLDRVFLVPSKISPHRSTAEYAPEKDRLEMLKTACRNYPVLEVSDYELNSDRISYTIYTVEHFRNIFPDDELFLLVGSDMFLSFDSWKYFEKIMENVTLIAVSRCNGDIPELLRKAEELGKYGKVLVSRAVPTEVSSSEIRKKISENQKISCYLDENVVQYITSKHLYQK